MAVAQQIRKRGFRDWYQRELLLGHSHLVLLLLCTLGFIGGLEAFTQPGADKPLLALALAAAAVVGAWALRRYLFVLMRAEHIANQAVCPGCQAYARWSVESDETVDGAVRLHVCCRRCAQRWPIEW